MLGPNSQPSDDQTGNPNLTKVLTSNNTTTNSSLSTKNIHLLIDKLQWKKYDSYQLFLYFIYSFLSGGLFLLFCFLYPNFKLKFLSIDCLPNEADLAVVMIAQSESIAICEHYYTPSPFITTTTTTTTASTTAAATAATTNKKEEHAVIMECDCIRFCASSFDGYVVRQIPIIPIHFERFFSSNYEQQLTETELLQEYSLLITQYGYNRMKVPEATFLEIGIRHLLSPFYLFQYFAVVIWYYEDYWLFSTLILIITLSAVYFTTVESVHNLEQLRQLVGSHHTVQVLNSRYNTLLRATKTIQESIPEKLHLENSTPDNIDEYCTYNDTVLIPGDKFIVTEGMTLPCDAILITGKVLVDESMLTGESVPVCKVPIDVHLINNVVQETKKSVLIHEKDTISSPSLKECRIPSNIPTKEEELDPYMKMTGNILFSGTKAKVIYGEICIAIVYKTSFRSAKGQLVASLLKPKDGFVTFISDALTAIFCMLVLVTFFYIITAYLLIEKNLSWGEVSFRYLDAISIAVPPALTACLTISTSISIDRLKKKNIYVADTTRVNFAGVISAVCFDKTGTLTESDLQFVGVYCRRREQGNASENNGNSNNYGDNNTFDTTEGGDVVALSRISEFEKFELSMSKRVPTAQTQSSSSNLETEAEEEHESQHHLHRREQILKKIPFLCQEIMATCHSLAFEKNSLSKPIGDPLEVELFETSLWSLHPSNNSSGNFYACPPLPHHPASNNTERGPSSSSSPQTHYEIIKHFEFTPERLRAASLVKEPSGRIMYLLKGSPEVIIKMCISSSLPIGIHEYLSSLARKGYRVIALAVKECLPEEITMSQEDIERSKVISSSSLYFYGLVYLSSALKKETKGTINHLRNANIHVNMITGDHINTAIAVATDCGIIRKTSSAVRRKRRFLAQRETNGAGGGGGSGDGEEFITYIIDEDSNGVVRVYDAQNGEELIDMTLHRAVYLASQTFLYQYLEILHYCYTNRTTNELSALNPFATKKNNNQAVFDASISNPLFSHSALTGSILRNTIHSSSAAIIHQKVIKKVELAMTGKALRNLQRHTFNRDLLRQAIHFTRIFARMKPHDKRYVVESLKETKQFETVDYDPTEDDDDDDDDEEEGEEDIEAGLVLTIPSRLTEASTGNKSLIESTDIEANEVVINRLHLKNPNDSSSGSPPHPHHHSKNSPTNNNNTKPLKGSSPISPSKSELKKLHSASSFHSSHSHTSDTKLIKTYGEPYDVLFCGDGANDMVALRAATIGVSLCDAETSVAAPITSKIQTPGSVVQVMIEGRCSLITAYVLILFTLMYGCIQLYFTLELYYYGLLVGDNMYIIQDMVYTLVLGYTMCKAEAYPILSIQQPPKRFLIWQNITKFFIMIGWFLVFQAISMYILTLQSFYTAYETDDPLTETYSYESSVIFNISLGQIMIASIVSCIDEPFRISWTKNLWQTRLLIIEMIWLFVQIFVQNSSFFQQEIEIKPVPIEFGLIMVAILILHFMICVGSAYAIDWFFEVKWDQHWSKQFSFFTVRQGLLKNKSALSSSGRGGGEETGGAMSAQQSMSFPSVGGSVGGSGGGNGKENGSGRPSSSSSAGRKSKSQPGKLIKKALSKEFGDKHDEDDKSSTHHRQHQQSFSNYSKLTTVGSGSDASSDAAKD